MDSITNVCCYYYQVLNEHCFILICFKHWNTLYLHLMLLGRNLDETTKSVYKENVRLSEALNYHMKEGELLKKERKRLCEENERLLGEKEVNDMMVQEKVIQAKQQKELIKEVGWLCAGQVMELCCSLWTLGMPGGLNEQLYD